MDERELYEAVWELSGYSHEVAGAERVVALAEGHWPEIAQRAPTTHDAEICRLTMLALGTLDSPQTAVWRSRALERFKSVGWHEAVGLMLISAAFGQLASDNDFYPEGKRLSVVRPSESALTLMREAEPLVDSAPSGFTLKEGSPSAERLRRQYPEKLGFLLTVSRDLTAATGSYELALAAADDDRGLLRCRLALVLVDYLASQNSGAASATNSLADQARLLGQAGADIVEAAVINVGVMGAGRLDVVSYERL